MKAEDKKRIMGEVDAFLTKLDSEFPEGFDLGIVAVVGEVNYQVDGEPNTAVWYRCSDMRTWLQAGLFRRAALVADYED
jgi:hypothetical protein